MRARDRSRAQDVGKAIVQRRDLVVGHFSLEANEKLVADVARRVVHAIEAQHFFTSLLGFLDDSVERLVLFRDQTVPEHALFDEPHQILEVAGLGTLDHHHRKRRLLAGLQQRQHFEALVQGAEPAGKQRHRVRFLQQEQLPGEEIAEVHELLVTADGLVGLLLERKLDIHTDTEIASRAFVSRTHDAASGSGDYHPPGVRHELSILDRTSVVRVGSLGTCRAENRHFPSLSKRREHFESVPHLFQCGVRDLEVDALGAVDAKAQRRHRDLLNVSSLGVDTTLVYQFLELPI